MHREARAVFLALAHYGYRWGARPVIFRTGPQRAHEQVLDLFARLDASPAPLRALHALMFPRWPVTVGGVDLDSPLMLAAGFVKGHGFEDETQAMDAVTRGHNIIPGHVSVPALLGAVEFGSFTRWPRIGNAGQVLWRDAPTRSTQNRVGLKNAGAKAAAAFLAGRVLPRTFGINIAVSPGVSDAEQERIEAVDAARFFIEAGVRPSWFTLNVSCPNTEDDPTGHQTRERTQALTAALRELVGDVPLWVKVSPALDPSQYAILMRVFADTGVRAVIATNTLGQPTPDDASVTAGVGGGRLHAEALKAAALLMDEKRRHGYAVDVIGCGGIMDAPGYARFAALGVVGAQYWSALVYEGLFAAARIAQDAQEWEHGR